MNRQPIIKTSGPRHPRRTSSPARAGHLTRRGSAVMAMLVVLTVVLGFAGLAWNVAHLRHAHNQMQTACESAALAGAAQLVDPTGGADRSRAMFMARQAALTLGSLNRGGVQPVLLLDNPKNDPRGDIVCGQLVEPTAVGSQMQLWQGVGDVNTLRVHAHRTKSRGNPLATWMGQLFGILPADVMSHAQATIDRRVFGFRPMVGTTAPVAPLVIDCNAWLGLSAGQVVTDNWTVTPSLCLVTSGGDGISEITVRACMNSAPTSGSKSVPTLVQLSLGSNEMACERQLLQGLTEHDLQAWQGALIIPSGGLLATIYNYVPADLGNTLWSVCGQPRAWPLAQLSTAACGTPTSPVTLLDFAGATVVDVQIDSTVQPPELLVTLQPTPLATSSALAGPGIPANPWLAKLMLTR